MATLGMSAAEREAIEAFKRDVVEPSMTSLVILDFWAEWCGPSKELGPVVEKNASEYESKGVKLVKIDVDTNKVVAAQFRVQSIPTVYAMFQGQLVADLTPMRSESQLKKALDQIVGQLPIQGEAQQQEADVEPLIAMGEEVLGSGDAARALSIFEQLSDMAPEMPAVIAGRARGLIQLGRGEEAQALLDGVSDDLAKDGAITQAKAALALAREAEPVDDLAGLTAQVEANPDDLMHVFISPADLWPSGIVTGRRICCSTAFSATANGTKARRAIGCSYCSRPSASPIPGSTPNAADFRPSFSHEERLGPAAIHFPAAGSATVSAPEPAAPYL